MRGGGIPKGYILVVDVEELENLDASEIHARRLNAKKALIPKGKNPHSRSQMDQSS